MNQHGLTVKYFVHVLFRLFRCGGCCSHPLLSCVPSDTKTENKAVIIIGKHFYNRNSRQLDTVVGVYINTMKTTFLFKFLFLTTYVFVYKWVMLHRLYAISPLLNFRPTNFPTYCNIRPTPAVYFCII